MEYKNLHKILGVCPYEWFLIKDKYGHYHGYFYISELGEMKSPERVRVYGRDGQYKSDKDLLAYAINNVDSVIYLTPKYFEDEGVCTPFWNQISTL